MSRFIYEPFGLRRNFEDEAAFVGAEGAVGFAGGAARVVALVKPAIEGCVVEASFDDEHLFGILVRLAAKRRRIRPCEKPRQPRVVLRRLIAC